VRNSAPHSSSRGRLCCFGGATRVLTAIRDTKQVPSALLTRLYTTAEFAIIYASENPCISILSDSLCTLSVLCG